MPGRAGRAAAAAVRYWFGEMEPYPLAAFRILFTLFLLCYFLTYAPHVAACFSTDGVYATLFIPDLALPPAGAWVLYGVVVALLLALLVGYATAIVTPLVLAGFVYYYLLHIATMNTSYDRLVVVFLVVACCARLDGAWSLRSGRSRRVLGGAVQRNVPAWPARLLAAQVALLYLGTGLYKLANPVWRSGRVIRETLVSSWATPLGLAIAAEDLPDAVYQCLAVGVITFEISAAVGLYVPRLRWAYFAGGALFHAGNWALFGIWQFLLCPAAYVLFMEPAMLGGAGLRIHTAAGECRRRVGQRLSLRGLRPSRRKRR